MSTLLIDAVSGFLWQGLILLLVCVAMGAVFCTR